MGEVDFNGKRIFAGLIIVLIFVFGPLLLTTINFPEYKECEYSPYYSPPRFCGPAGFYIVRVFFSTGILFAGLVSLLTLWEMEEGHFYFFEVKKKKKRRKKK